MFHTQKLLLDTLNLKPSGRACILAVTAGCLSGCKTGVLDPMGPIGGAEKIILIDSLGIMAAIVVPTMFAIIGFAWWFRASNSKARYLPNWSYSGEIELIVWSIPALVVLFLGGIAWISSHDLDPARPLQGAKKPLEVEVVSLDWKWLFIYPGQDIASLNKLVVPVGTPVHFQLTSATVMNVFFVPQLGSEIYTMNGMVTQLYLQADRTGTYPGLSAHFSGDGFSDMNFDLDAVSDDHFATWVATAQKSSTALDNATYRDLLRQTSHLEPMTYRSVTPSLFQDIAHQVLPPGNGPAAQAGSSSDDLKAKPCAGVEGSGC